MRVLSVSKIPTELWVDEVLHLPPASVNCYIAELTNLGLLEDAKVGTDKKSIHGGCNAVETLEHFTYRFSVSSGRVEFAALAPVSSLVPISDALLSTFSDGHVTLLDIPCGHGSSAVTLLTTLATLRASKAIPSLPLTVTVVGGDCSDKALEIFNSIMSCLKQGIKESGIEIIWFTQYWDATRADSTAKLIDQWFSCSNGAGEYVVCLVNFSGALKEAGFLESFKPSLEQILGRLHDKKSTFIWVEPTSETLKTKFLPKIVEFFKKRISWFSPADSSTDFETANYKMLDPLNGKIFNSGLEVHRFVRK